MRASLTVLAILALATGAIGPVRAAEVKERTTYFNVRGTTLEDLDRELNRKGPLAARSGLRHPGATEVKFDGNVTYRSAGSRCKVARTDLSLRLVMMLPRWKAPKAASPMTVIVWTTLAEDIRRHEAQHAAIAKLWLKKMESGLRNLAPAASCEAMEARVDAATTRFLSGHAAAQAEFDRVEGRDMNARLKRALSERLGRAGASG